MNLRHPTLFAILFFALIQLSLYLYQHREIRYGPGQIAPDEPVQTLIPNARDFSFGNYTIKPLANFSLKARALSSERYAHDPGAELAPINIAFGWGVMSNEEVLREIDFSQVDQKDLKRYA